MVCFCCRCRCVVLSGVQAGLGWGKVLPFVLTREPGRLAARSIISAFLEVRGEGKASLFGGGGWTDGRGTGSGRVWIIRELV